MNDLSNTVRRPCYSSLPAAVPLLLLLLFLAGLGVAVFILVVVHNAAFLVSVLVVSALIVILFIWNVVAYRRSLAIHRFLDRFPETDLLIANDGQLVKISGFVSCGDVSLESSYEKAGRCVYTSTLLYEYSRCQPKQSCINHHYFQWNLAYMERFVTDFYITDINSGARALVKAGCDSKVFPLIEENILVNITNLNRELSSTMKNWLQGRGLSCEARLLRLEEGCIKEGTCLTVMGILSRKNGVIMIVPPPETILTGCLLRKCIFPVEFDGLLLKAADNSTTNIDPS